MPKISWTVFARFQKTFCENKLTFKKRAVYNTSDALQT